jgi:osmoprotectant transport system permease protein
MLTQPKVEVFTAEKEKVSLRRVMLTIMLIGLMGALASPQPLDLEPTPWTALVRSAISILIAFFIIALALFGAARLFGGSGKFMQHLYVMATLAVPGAVVLGLMSRVDFKQALSDLTSLLGLITIVLLLLLIYGFLLILLAIDGVHNTGGRNAVRVVGSVVLSTAILSLVYAFLSGTKNTLVNYLLYIAEKRSELLDLSIAHAKIVLFSMAIAIALGVIIGILITLPPHRPRLWHLVFLAPLAAFGLLWFGSRGTLGPEAAAWFDETGIIGGFITRPKAVGIVGMILLTLFFVLYVSGESAADVVLYTAGILLTIPSIALFGMFIPIFGIGFFNAAVALILYAQLPILRNTYTGIKEVNPAVIESARGMGMTDWQILYKIKIPLAVPVIMAGIRVSMVMIVGIAAIATLIGVEVLGRFIFDGMQRISDRMVFAGAVAVSIFAIAVDILLGWGETLLTPSGLRGRARRAEG